MFTELILHEHPTIIKGFMGISAEVFWMIVEVVTLHLPDIDRQRLERSDRKRQSGAGRECDQPVAIRVAAVLTYMRLHVPQIAVALMYGLTQTDISRDLRRLMPAIQAALPCPQVWELLESGQEIAETKKLAFEELANGRVLADATEQRVSRPTDSETRKECYSGKKKQFTIKTQFVVDGEHHIKAISESVPGAEHDKALSDEIRTVEHLPDGCELDADKGYQGLDKQVSQVTMVNPETGEQQSVARLIVQTPYKKPRGGELTEEQKAFNAVLNAIRVRIEHCTGWAKNWAILANRFRCAHSIYTSIMRTICGLVNLQTQHWQAAKAANSA
jgi:hypothetical protein